MAVINLVAEVKHSDPALSGEFPFPPFAQVQFERERKKSLRSLETLEDIYYACWLATRSHLQGSGSGRLPAFDEWLKGLEAADVTAPDSPLD